MNLAFHVAFPVGFLTVLAGCLFVWPALPILAGFAVMVTVLYLGAKAHHERGNNA